MKSFRILLFLLTPAVYGMENDVHATTSGPSSTFHISPQGNDFNNGSAAAPFATLERVRDAIRENKKISMSGGGITVLIHGGIYHPARTFTLTAEDSGTAEAPVIYRAAAGESPCWVGGLPVKEFQRVTDPAILARLPEESRGKVFQASLSASGISKVLPVRLGGYGSGRGFHTTPVANLFFNGESLQLARWPNKGTVAISQISSPDSDGKKGPPSSKAGVFCCDTDRLARWTQDRDIVLYGYWCYNWADSYESVRSIDPARHEITLEPPFHIYGYSKGQSFYALNLLSEIDEPGEWYLDRASGILYLYPPSDPNRALVEISTSDFPFISTKDTTHIHFQGLAWDLGGVDGIQIRGGSDISLEGCSFSRLGGYGVVIQNGTRHKLLSCDIHTMGRGGVILDGGNRKNLTPGGNSVENCHIYDLSRVDHTYTPAILVNGVGNRVVHNLIHDMPSSAMRVEGNDHVIEMNEVSRVVLESDDQGAVDMWGDPVARGNVFRDNYWHHIGSWRNPHGEPHLGQAGIRFDDAISGQQVIHNIFRHCGTEKGFGAIQIHGGKENRIDRNLFVDCPAAMSFSPWDTPRWLAFIRGRFPSSEFDQNLYVSRYPALAHLAESPNVNEISHNLAMRCGTFLLNNSSFARLDANIIDPPDKTEGANKIPVPFSTEDMQRADIDPARFAAIGLYRDSWRTEIPAKLIRDLRGDS